jgi:hypothetical protein
MAGGLVLMKKYYCQQDLCGWIGLNETEVLLFDLNLLNST